MNVNSYIFQHPKWLQFRNQAGAGAMEYLCRLWGFCQQGHRKENLGKVSPRYVESICNWNGPEDQLFTLLTNSGWIRVSKTGDVIVHNWNKHNSALLRSWDNGARGGRPRKHSNNNTVNALCTHDTGNPDLTQTEPRLTHGLPVGSARLTQANPEQTQTEPSETLLDRIGLDRSTTKGERESSTQVPSLEEVLEWGKMDGVAEAVCRDFFDHYDGLQWMYGRTPIAKPRRWLKRFSESRRRVGGARRESAGSLIFQKKTRLEQLEKLIEEHPGHPNANFSQPATPEERTQFRAMLEEVNKLRHDLAQVNQPEVSSV